MHRILETVHQERRRLLFAIVLSYVAGLLAHLHLGLFLSGWPVAIFFASLQATLVGVFALLICMFAPSLRFMIEAFAVSRLVFALFVFAFPDIGYPVLTSPFWAASVVILGGYAASRVIHGRFRNLPIPAKRTNRRPARVRAQPWQQRFVHWVDDTEPDLVR